ncbi:MAG TPA: hypothetical protein VHQ47_20845 [Phycisphaerae bacterium]|jgi:hypothetical protein|nr:hypothetical protein [Phycisphaerae bacterium]
MGKKPRPGKVRAQRLKGAVPALQETAPLPPIGMIVTVGGMAAIVIAHDRGAPVTEDAAGRVITGAKLETPATGGALYRASQVLTRDREWLQAADATADGVAGGGE